MTDIAVIGIDAKFGAHDTIDQVERAFYQGTSLTGSAAGSPEDSLDLVTSCLDTAQRLTSSNQLQVSDIAMVVVFDSGNELAITKLTQQLSTQCLSCDVYADLGAAMTRGTELTALDTNAVALIGLNDTLNTDKKIAAQTISFDQDFNGYGTFAGIASLLLASASFAKRQQAYLYSVIKGFARGALDADVAKVSIDALAISGVNASDVELVEVSALKDQQMILSESLGLISSYGASESLHQAISCARSIVGDSGGFTQVAGLLKTVLSLHQRYIPALAAWQQPNEQALTAWTESSFYFPVNARPWFPNANGAPHTAAVSCLSSNNSYTHIIVQENILVDDLRVNGYFAASDLTLVVVAGDNESDLQQQLAIIQGSSSNSLSLKKIAQTAYANAKNSSRYHISLIAESLSDLEKELSLAQAGISKAFKDNSEWKTPKGSYFSANPAAGDNLSGEKSDSVAFVYPGIGATYVGLGRDLFHLFPQIYQPVAGLADDIGSSLKDRLLNPRSIVRHSFKDLKQLDLELRGNLANIAEAGVGFACVFTKVFEEVFDVKADFATGYSMGEVSMYAALGCWQQPGLMSARLATSNTFNHQLCGELRTLRDHWQLPDVADGVFEQIWETYTIKATIEQVKLATVNEPRVYCTIVNTPDNLLLAGYPEDCLRVVKQLGVRAMALNMANAIHSAPAYAEYDHMVALYTMDVTPRIKTKMYSSSCYLPIPQMSKAIAHSIAKCLCDVVDFPRLITTLHDKGARVFVEMGPGRSLCAWIDKILAAQAKDHPIENHVSVPVNAKGTSDELTYLRAIAKLISHGLDLNLDSLFYGSIVINIDDVATKSKSTNILKN